jgi:hypothetical protein
MRIYNSIAKRGKIKRLLIEEKGSALLLALIIMVMLTFIFIAALTTSITEMDISKNMNERTSAFYLAEAGLELGIKVLKNNPNMQNNDTLEMLVNANPNLGSGSFRVDVTGTVPYKILTSSGKSREGVSEVQVIVKRKKNPYNIWNNIVFAGVGQSGHRDPAEPYTDVNGNGVYDGALTAVDLACELNGTARIYNNYAGINSALSSRIPPLDTTTFNGEVVNTLDAELRVKHGRLSLSGSASVGQSEVSGNSVKETVDGCYVNDGYTGNKGASQVYSDNGTNQVYDLENDLKFPNLTDPYTDPLTGHSYTSFQEYLSSNALVIAGDLNLKPGVSYPYASNAYGSIYVDNSGNLQISGIVYVTGNITIDAGSDGLKSAPILYHGKGTLVSANNINIRTHVLSKGMFPANDVMGFIAAKDLNIGTGSGDSHLNIIGAFFAQDKITNAKQNQIAGAMVSNYFQISNVPDLFQVPSLTDNLPPGMPGSGTIYAYTYQIVPNSWREL